ADEPEGHCFNFQRGIDRGVGAAVQQGLRQPNRERRLFRQFRHEPADLRRKRLVRYGLRYEADRLGFLRGEPQPEQHEFLRLCLTDDADEPLTAAGPGDETQVDLRLAELRPTLGDPEIACEGDLKTAAETVPVDRGNRRLREIRQVGDDRLGPLRETPHLERFRDVAERREVRSRAKRSVTRTRDDDGADAVFVPEDGERLLELLEDLWTQGVEPIRPVDCDGRYMGRRILGVEE